MAGASSVCEGETVVVDTNHMLAFVDAVTCELTDP